MRVRAQLAALLLGLAWLTGLAAGRDAVPAAPPASTLVVCAPGYPGSTAEAQPAMDALAAAVSKAAGLKPGEFKAVYFETQRAGLDRIASADAAMVLAPLPFWLQHRAALKLEPFMQAVEENGTAAEAWTLVATSGRVRSAADLAGFELISAAGYAPRFVRGPALGAWGEVPADVRITFSGAVLTGLRRASTGAKVALLLDRAQAAALPSLPFASKLQIVATSGPLPVSVLSTVAGRVPPAWRAAVAAALAALDKTPVGAEALASVRLSRFVPADQAALARAGGAFDRTKE